MVLPQKTHSFKDWAEALNSFAQSEELKKQAAYWAQADAEELQPAPKDHDPNKRLVKHTAAVKCELTEEETAQPPQMFIIRTGRKSTTFCSARSA
ncbi:condensation domain-containing protein [Bacillus velezensis]|nr:condensation domain-containing protein [Bacillus velezensis]